MGPSVIKYPLDLTSVSPDNLVIGEIQTMPARTKRAIAPEYGAFYTKSLIITDQANNQQLTTDQYYAATMLAVPTMMSGEEVCAIIMITDPSVSDTVSLQYQAVGGEWSASATAIVQQIYNLNLDDRPAAWPAIIGKPDAFPPSAHLHDAGDLFGFEYVVKAINDVEAAILMGDSASHDAILKYIDSLVAGLAGQYDDLNARLNAHTQDTTNPHRTTADQVGAFTKAETTSAINTAKTDLQTNIDGVASDLSIHEGRNDNPHAVSAAQVGAYTKAQSDANLTAMQTTLQNSINSNVTNLQNQINNKAPVRGDYVYTASNQTVQLGNITSVGTIYCYNDIWAFLSDERLKENIEPIENALEKVLSLDGVTYNHTEEACRLMGLDPDRRYVGLLAGQVQNAQPELVGRAPFDIDPETGGSRTGQDYRTLQYDKTIALLVEGMKDFYRQFQAFKRATTRQAAFAG